MAVHHPTPTCPYCNKPLAKARHKDETDVPLHQRIIGDTFISWEYKEHSCRGSRKAKKERAKAFKLSGAPTIDQIIRDYNAKRNKK